MAHPSFFDRRDQFLVSPLFLAAVVTDVAPHAIPDAAALTTAKADDVAAWSIDGVVKVHALTFLRVLKKIVLYQVRGEAR